MAELSKNAPRMPFGTEIEEGAVGTNAINDMKKLFYLAAIACMALFSSCEKEGVPHTGDDTGNLYGVWALTTKTTITKASDGTVTTNEVDYTKCHFYLAFSEFPFPHFIAKKGSFTDFDLDDVDVNAGRFSYNSDSKKITFKKNVWLSDEVLKYNMILDGTLDVAELSSKKFVIQQTIGGTTTVYSYIRQSEKQ